MLENAPDFLKNSSSRGMPDTVMIPTLPPELHSYIVNFLHNNKPALSACSLSCRALASASKPFLFHALRTRLDSEDAYRFERLLEFDPTVLPLVKRIEVTILTFNPGPDPTISAISRIMAHSDHAQYTAPVLNIVIRDILSNPRFTQSILPLLSPVADWVVSLDLNDLDLREEMHFWNLVLAFRMLKSLVLGRLNVELAGVHAPFHTEPKISHLSLKPSSLRGASTVCRFLAHHPMPLPSLTSLDVRFPQEFDQYSTQFGERYGPRVRTLRFGVVILRYCSAKHMDQILNRKF